LGKVREDETTNELFGFLTTEPNAIGAPIHAMAAPVILATREEIDACMSARASTTAI
jgi:putative SOS response-associated peptidase YedK